MSDEHPEFTLPEWGEDGAPPEPAGADENDGPGVDSGRQELEIHVEPQILLATTPLPDRWSVTTVHGLVSATARGKGDEPDDRQAKATTKAIAALEEEAGRMGADAVVGIRLTATRHKGAVVVTAYGTAVGVSD